MPIDEDARYSRFNYVDPPLLHTHLMENEKELEKHILQVQNEPDGYEVLFAQMALENVKVELRKVMMELEEEQSLMDRFRQPQAGMYQRIPPQLLAEPKEDTTTTTAIDESNAVVTVEGVDEDTIGRLRAISVGSETDGSARAAVARPGRSGSIDSRDSYGSNSERKRRPLLVLPASVYNEEGSYQMYQAEDGQLCFLSKFNMNCLMTEFSTFKPKDNNDNEKNDGAAPATATLQEGDDDVVGIEKATQTQRKRMPLPDYVEGNVVEIEPIHLTDELRRRMPFLAHLPIHTDISFVELDLSRILGDETKRKHKNEFERRRKKRKNKKDAEKRADKAIKAKEEQRINELKARIQRIDPNDDFFLATAAVPDSTPAFFGDDFGPSIASSSSGAAVGNNDTAVASSMGVTASNPYGSFRSIISTPSSMAMSEEAFPSLGGTARPQQQSLQTQTQAQAQQGWGSGWQAASGKPKPVDSVVAGVAVGSPTPRPGGGKRKKSKGKKIVLFSTGGHRGQG